MKISIFFVILCATYAISNQVTVRKSRVIGNINPEAGAYPFIVSVQIDGTHRCGGAVYSLRLVLTAASCVNGTDPNHVSIFAGETWLNKTDSKYASWHQIDKIITYQNFNITRDNIAMLHSTKEMKGRFLRSIPILPKDTADYQYLYICGWGQSSRNGSNISNDLHGVESEAISIEECKTKVDPDVEVDSKNICVLQTDLDRDLGPCEFDEGGPLFNPGDETEYLHGIATPILKCGLFDRQYADVYTRVGAYSDWISEVENSYKDQAVKSFEINHLILWIILIVNLIQVI